MDYRETWRRNQLEHLEVSDEALTWCQGPVGVRGRNGANTYRGGDSRGKSRLSEEVTEGFFSDRTGYNIFSALSCDVVWTTKRSLVSPAKQIRARHACKQAPFEKVIFSIRDEGGYVDRAASLAHEGADWSTSNDGYSYHGGGPGCHAVRKPAQELLHVCHCSRSSGERLTQIFAASSSSRGAEEAWTRALQKWGHAQKRCSASGRVKEAVQACP